MESEDLRDWLAKVESMGELKRIEGADWNLEIACFADPKVSGEMRSVFLFDNVKDYPSGFRFCNPRLVTEGQTTLTLNLPKASQMEIIDMLRQKWPEWEASLDKFPPRVVKRGPILENVLKGKEVDLLKFPTPKWHKEDGGRYIGTADAVITRDPDTGEVNLGTQRVMIHDKNTTGIFVAPGHHGRINYEKYHAKGQSCPVLVSVGHHPLIFVVACTDVIGCEYNWAGAIRGEPIEVVNEEVTGLPMPADAEIVLAGWIPPNKTKVEGPFGEWTGYYGRPPSEVPVIEVERIYHRNNPILLGYAPLRPQPGHSLLTMAVINSAIVHNQLTKYGVPDVKRVWMSEAGLTTFIIISIKQRYAGHAKRVGLLASQSASNQQARYVVVVDEDIDPSNMHDVIWALGFRSDPAKTLDIIRGCRTEPLDPMWTPPNPIVNSVAIIDACKPFERLATFPKVIEVDPDYASKFRKKWKDILK